MLLVELNWIKVDVQLQAGIWLRSGALGFEAAEERAVEQDSQTHEV